MNNIPSELKPTINHSTATTNHTHKFSNTVQLIGTSLVLMSILSGCSILGKKTETVANIPKNNVSQNHATVNSNTTSPSKKEALTPFVGNSKDLQVNHTHQNNQYQVAPIDNDIQQKIKQAVDNTNKLRAEKGLPPLKYDANLSAYAQVRAKEIERHFAHTRPDGKGFEVGISSGYAGENIAAGHATADETVLVQWRNSTGHYQNMIRANYTKIGIGMVYIPNSKYGYYWVQIFGDDGVTSDYHFSKATDKSNSSPLNKLVIGDKVISLVAPNGQWQHSTNENLHYNGYQHTRFGKMADEFFYQGMQTPISSMPNQGNIHYTGDAIVVNNQTHYGKTAFDVDFANKTLQGNISADGILAIGIQADIVGNRFVGKGATKNQGAFFGENAQELAGVFDTQNGTKGSFGAKSN